MRKINSIRIGKSKKIFSPEVRRQHVDDWHTSGLSMSDYCRHHGLAISTEIKIKAAKNTGNIQAASTTFIKICWLWRNRVK